MEEYGVLDYVPVIGDIYRYGKLGWKIGSWLSDADSSYNNSVLSEMAECLNRAGNASDIPDAVDDVLEAMSLVDRFDFENAKKFHAVLLYYLAARACHIFALCNCYAYSNNLAELKDCKRYFKNAIGFCNKVWEVDKTIFTEKRSSIDEVRKMSDEKKAEIKKSRSNWRKQYRALYRKMYPWKWYLGMWIFA